MREKLIELIEESTGVTYGGEYGDEEIQGEIDICDEEIERIADHLIANGVTVLDCKKDCANCWKTQLVTPRWIPVTERLPEIRERVLVYHDDGMIRFGINYGGFADVVSSIYLNHNHHTCFSKVTHWMPLPEPPKGSAP